MQKVSMKDPVKMLVDLRRRAVPRWWSEASESIRMVFGIGGAGVVVVTASSLFLLDPEFADKMKMLRDSIGG
ncbi:hypothetical protein GS504_01530 [Rhodococcus hoagii]|nr:hypothetical protein [Prescottella equi]